MEVGIAGLQKVALTSHHRFYLAAARNQLSPAHLGILQSGISPQCTFQISGLGSCLWESYQNFTRRQVHQVVCRRMEIQLGIFKNFFETWDIF